MKLYKIRERHTGEVKLFDYNSTDEDEICERYSFEFWSNPTVIELTGTEEEL